MIKIGLSSSDSLSILFKQKHLHASLFALRALKVCCVVVAFIGVFFEAAFVNRKASFFKERRGFVIMDPLLLITFSFLFLCGCECEESKLKLITVVLGTVVDYRRHCN